MENPFNVAHKTILITGASSGIGKEVSVLLSKLGASVIVIGRNKERLQASFDELAQIGEQQHQKHLVDLTQPVAVQQMMQALKSSGVKIDGVVHCAGISSTIPLRLLTEEKLQHHFQTNVTASILLTKELVSKKHGLMLDGGSFVFITSIMATFGAAGKTAYAMTKGALLAGVKSLAIELASRNIRINAISPGVVVTPMSSASFYSKNEERLEKIKELHPLGLGTPEDVANACVYFLSDASKWITGTNLVVDGGYTAR